MNKNPQTLDELMELIKDKNFRPTCAELEKIIDRYKEIDSWYNTTKIEKKDFERNTRF